MATLLVKSLSLLGGVVGLTTAGFGAVYLTSKTKKEEKKTDENITPTPIKPTVNQSINKLLKAKKLRLLTRETKDEEKWTKKLEALRTANPSATPPEPWNFSKWEQDKNKPITMESFKKQCEEFSKKEITLESDTTYVAISTYCTEQESA